MQINEITSANLESCTLAIGSFDGVHSGHLALVQSMSASAAQLGIPSAVLTFFPHPAVVLRGWEAPSYLTPPSVRAQLLQEAGADVVITQNFDRAFSALRAGEFLERVREHLSPKQIWIGEDFAFGYRREGNRDFLLKAQEAYGFRLNIVKPVMLDGGIVSSTRIRKALQAGNVRLASRLQARPFTVAGNVVHGAGRGTQLGIPTANLEVWPEQLLPAIGVYAGRATIRQGSYPAVINIGVRPTFNANVPPLAVEAHLLDFEGQLYDQHLSLAFVERLRDERRFDSVEALQTQIGRDIVRTRSILKLEGSHG
ncbi:MAG: bifunctional riboflavin kinase/FAD synthetase [Anaerolineales bacterium]|nr:bifunctional riboflavin kinase/FAD synthetase [Anaerolineales bacterium]